MQTAQATCSKCGNNFTTFARWAAEMKECGDCAKKREEGETIDLRNTLLNDVETFSRVIMSRIGARRAEFKAEAKAVPKRLKDRLPSDIVCDFLAGRFPRQGFGLTGGQGVGKTCVIAFLVKACIQVNLRDAISTASISDMREAEASHVPRLVANHYCPAKWVFWPEAASTLKDMSTRPGHEVETFVDKVKSAGLLILDDLGRERMRGTYTEDYSAGVLDRVVTDRTRSERPIIWTSNLDAAKLADLYGAAFMSRLEGASPSIQLPADLPDLRISGD